MAVSLVLMALAGWAIYRADVGLDRETLLVSGIPVEWMRPAGDEPLPVVVLAHGSAGSHQIMGALARTFAHAGYATASLDLAGHGQSRQLSPSAGLGSSERDIVKCCGSSHIRRRSHGCLR